MRESTIKACIETIEDHKDKMIQGLRKAAEAKGENPTEENLALEPFIALYNQISDCSIKMFGLPTVDQAYKILEDKLTDEEMQKIISMLVLIMSNSAHSAILFYDEHLEGVLSKQFLEITEKLNLHGSIIDGHDDILKVYRNKVDALEHEIKMLKVKLDIGN